MFSENDIISKWDAQMYDLNETETYDVEFILSLLGKTPKRVLEIACGSGRILVPAAKAGHEVLGLDINEHMLERIDKKTEGIKGLRYRKSDVIRDEWESGFDVVLLAANFFSNIVSDTDQEEAQEMMIKKAADALVKGGHVLIDYAYTLHPELWFDSPEPHFVWEGTDDDGNRGKMLLLDNTYDKETGTARFVRMIEMTLADGSRILRNTQGEKHFAEIAQVREWLSAYGFAIENEWGNYAKDPISEYTDRAIILAKKV